MCVASMVTDHYQDKWPVYKPTFDPLPPIYPAFRAITKEQWEEYQELKRKAEEYDKRNGEPECVKTGVAEWEAVIKSQIDAYVAVTNDVQE